jgi:hypothetical protein
MIAWTIFITIAVLLALLALKGMGWMKARAASASAKVDKYGGSAWTTAESEIDDYVADAKRLWPVLKPMALFWIALATLSGMVALNVYFGLIVGGWKLSVVTLILIVFFSAADLVLAVTAVRGDRGNGEWYEFTEGDRSAGGWALIIICTALSMLVVVLSTGDIHRGVAAQQGVTQSKWSEMQLQVDQMTLQRKLLQDKRTANGGLSRQALEIRAKETAEAADREGQRKKCASKCEQLKKEAQDWAAQAADARTEDELTEKIASMQAQLATADDIKDGSDPVEDFAATVGADYKTFKKWMFIAIGFVFAIVNTLLWLMVGDEAGKARAAEYARRAGIGDQTRKNKFNLPPKYTVPLQPQLALPAPTDGKSGDTIVVNITQQEDMRRRFANDADLLEVDGLFGTLLHPVNDGGTSISELYNAYRKSVLTLNPSARYMTQPTMATKINTITQHRDDVKFSGDGIILGWALKAATAQAAE